MYLKIVKCEHIVFKGLAVLLKMSLCLCLNRVIVHFPIKTHKIRL